MEINILLAYASTHGSTQEVAETRTDNYGDFEFEGLEANGAYELSVEKGGYQGEVVRSIGTQDDVYLGQISLTPKG